MVATQTVEKTDPSEVQVADVMAFTYWGKVDKAERGFLGNKITLTDLDSGNQFAVDGDELIKGSHSADQYSRIEKVTKSQAVEILASAHNVPFTVTFVKKDGAHRVLRGRLIGIDQKNLGYIDVEDLDQPDGQRFRMVDCRTIKEIIVNGVKYVV